MPTLTHPTAGTADFPEKVVQFWEDRGWSREPGEQPPAPRRLLVLARTKTDAATYAADVDADWLYAVDGDSVRGLSPDSTDVAVLDGFTEHRHHADITEALAGAGFSLS